MMKVRMIEQRDNGVCLFELKNDEIKVITSNLGCHVLSVFTKDREGNFGDVVLGFENVEDCWHGDGSYMGAIAGRVANRIGDAKFELNGKTYELAANNGRCHLIHQSTWFSKVYILCILSGLRQKY
jgi:aldose 1-epimerase